MHRGYQITKAIDRFQSCGQQLCKLLGIKESFNMWQEFSSYRIFFVHKQGPRFIVLYTNMAADSLFCTQIWPSWCHLKTIYRKIRGSLAFVLLKISERQGYNFKPDTNSDSCLTEKLLTFLAMPKRWRKPCTTRQCNLRKGLSMLLR